MKTTQPEYIFETSWEVCNRVGGIYAVLSTRAASMQAEHPDKVIFFGPDLGNSSDKFFREDKDLLKGKLSHCRIGRWQVPGQPIAVLLPWQQLQEQKNAIYAWAWEHFGVQSHAANGDYDDSCLFAYAAGQKMEELYRALGEPVTCAHTNEWQTAFTLFYLQAHCPQIATLFTTHATGIGRSIAGNGKPLYDYFTGYHGDQMAEELGLVSKHSVEKQAAWHADCFTTVSDLTAHECLQLLDKQPDIVTPNGFESGFVPSKTIFPDKRKKASVALLRLAEEKTGNTFQTSPLMLCIAGRQEWKNKGIDIFLDSMQRLAEQLQGTSHTVIAWVLIPYLSQPMRDLGNVKVIFIPHYLPTNDEPAIKGFSYYDLLIGMDLSVFPSYYEPWGYTPLESVAFHVPTITTSLAGFGLWAEGAQAKMTHKPVHIIHRTDSNYWDVVSEIVTSVVTYLEMTTKEQGLFRKAAAALAAKADWKHFYPFYRKAYQIALEHMSKRNK